MADVNVDISFKIVSSVIGVETEYLHAGTTESRVYKVSDFVRLGTTESKSSMKHESMLLGTSESRLVGPEYVGLGTSESRVRETSSTGTFDARVRHGILERDNMDDCYARVRSEVTDVTIYPDDFHFKCVSDIRGAITISGFEFWYNTNDIVEQVINRESKSLAVWDSYTTLHWIASPGEDIRYMLSYKALNGDPASRKPIVASLPRTSDTTPTLTWTSETITEDQVITYDVQVASDENFNNLVIDKTDVPIGSALTTYTLTAALTVGSTYWFRVRGYDAVEYGDWSPAKYFDVVTSATITLANTLVNALGEDDERLLSAGLMSYHWNTSNMEEYNSSGDRIQYKVYIEQFSDADDDGTFIKSGTYAEAGPFYIDHTAPNPPLFKYVFYNPQTHLIECGLQIFDSKNRLYDLTDFAIHDGRFPESNWTQIRPLRILGQTRRLGSTPVNDNLGIFTWNPSYDADMAFNDFQDLTYDFIMCSAPELPDDAFYWTVREYYEGDHDYDLTNIGWGDGSGWWAPQDTQTVGTVVIDVLSSTASFSASVLTDSNTSTSVTLPGTATITFDLKNTYYVESVETVMSESKVGRMTIYTSDDATTWTDVRHTGSLISNDYLIRTTARYIKLDFSATASFTIQDVHLWGRLNWFEQNHTGAATATYINPTTQDFIVNSLNLNWSALTFNDKDLIDPKDYVPSSTLPYLQISPRRMRFEIMLTRNKDLSGCLYTQAGIIVNNVTLDPVDLFDAGVTTCIFKKFGLTKPMYQLTPREKDLIYRKIGTDPYYWSVRGYDTYDYGLWAPFIRPLDDKNTHWVMIDIYELGLGQDHTGYGLEPGGKYRLRCYAYPSDLEESDAPSFNWNHSRNPEIDLGKALEDVFTIQKTSLESAKAAAQERLVAESGNITLSW